VPHAPLGVFHITRVARNDVNVDMQNTLSGRRPYIDADIVAIGTELRVQMLALLGDQLHAGRHFFRRQLEEAGHVATRNHQGMPRAHCEAVAGTVRQFILS
jgi:FKBP-type peptidyl-prolyl cis-trans isomerase 2